MRILLVAMRITAVLKRFTRTRLAEKSAADPEMAEKVCGLGEDDGMTWHCLSLLTTG